MMFLTFSSSAEIITLKDGKTLEGKVIGADDGSIKIKSGEEVYTFRRIDIETIKAKEPPEEFLLPPEKVYEKMALRINQSDPEAHYKLGLFCLERDIPQYAAKEFDLAKGLDRKYAKIIDAQLQAIYEAEAKAKYDIGLYCYNHGEIELATRIFEEAIQAYPKSRLVKKCESMLELIKEEKSLLPPLLTEEEVKVRFKNEEAPVPYTISDRNKIGGYISTLYGDEKKNAKRLAICSTYWDMAGQYEGRARSDSSNPKRWRDLRIARYCYSLASYDVSFSMLTRGILMSIIGELEKDFKERLLIPTTLTELKAMEALLGELDHASPEKELAFNLYYEVATDYEAKADGQKIQDKRKELLRVAANCYLILRNAFSGNPDFERVGTYGWARCYGELEGKI